MRRGHLQVTIHVQTMILRSKDYRTVVHQGHVKALGMFHLRFVGRHQLTVLGEQSQIEVVVIVRDQNLALTVEPHANWIVSDALSAYLTKVLTFIIEHLKKRVIRKYYEPKFRI